MKLKKYLQTICNNLPRDVKEFEVTLNVDEDMEVYPVSALWSNKVTFRIKRK